MITEKEQFKRELVQQEIQANKRILAGFRYFTTTYVAVWFLSMVGFFEMDRGKMTVALFVMLPMLVVPEIIGNHHDGCDRGYFHDPCGARLRAAAALCGTVPPEQGTVVHVRDQYRYDAVQLAVRILLWDL